MGRRPVELPFNQFIQNDSLFLSTEEKGILEAERFATRTGRPVAVRPLREQVAPTLEEEFRALAFADNGGAKQNEYHFARIRAKLIQRDLLKRNPDLKK